MAIGELVRRLSETGVPTRTDKTVWDRSTVWGMLRNPAYAGRACFAKTTRAPRQRGLTRTARLTGRATPTAYTVTDRLREDWLEIPVAARRLADNKRFATRNTQVLSLLQGLTTCSGCGYAYYCYEHGRVCDTKPVWTDHLDAVAWTHISELLAAPALIRAEIDRRLAQLRTADPTTARQQRLETALASLRSALGRLAAQLVDREAYLKIAENLEGFLAQLRDTIGTATVEQRQRALRLLAKEILVGPEQIVIRHSIPTRGDTTRADAITEVLHACMTTAAVEEGALAGDPDRTAAMVWALGHDAVDLDLSGRLRKRAISPTDERLVHELILRLSAPA